MQVKHVRPAHAGQLRAPLPRHRVPAFLLHLREPRRADLRDELIAPRLERAIGVIYRPETELQSHYFQASLPAQFDEYVWFDSTTSIHPLTSNLLPETT